MWFAEEITPPDPRLHVCTDVRELPQWEAVLKHCSLRRKFSFDTETDGFYWFRDNRTIGYCAGYDLDDGYGERGVYFPHSHLTPDVQLPKQHVVDMFGRILGDPNAHAIGHNTPFDVHFAEADGITVRAHLHDTQTMQRIVNENVKTRVLEDLVAHHKLDSQPYFWKERVKDVNRRILQRRGLKMGEAPGYALIPTGILGPYGANDGRFALGLAQRLLPLIDEHWASPYSIELELAPVLIAAERHGMKINVEYIHELHAKCLAKIAELKQRIRDALGFELNPRNDEEVIDLVYRRFGNEVKFLTDAVHRDAEGHEFRRPSVDVTALRDIVHHSNSEFQRGVVKLILEFRDTDKIRSTYTVPLLEFVDANGFLHGTLDPGGTTSGRLASRDPNLQNFPSEDKDGVRRAFEVTPGRIAVFMDFSQVELRVLAFLSREPTLWEAFMLGKDVHAATSMRMFGKADKSNRRVAKVINFGVAYGMTKYGIRDNLNKSADPERGIPTVTEEDAAGHLEHWHKLFPRVSKWTHELCADMLRRSPPSFTNMFGRTRRVYELAGSTRAEQRSGIRKAVAAKVQGTAAYLAKIALVRLDRLCKWGREKGYFDANIITNVHDDIRTDVNPEGAAHFAVCAKSEMERWPEFHPLPILVDAEWSATTWEAKTKIWPEEKH